MELNEMPSSKRWRKPRSSTIRTSSSRRKMITTQDLAHQEEASLKEEEETLEGEDSLHQMAEERRLRFKIISLRVMVNRERRHLLSPISLSLIRQRKSPLPSPNVPNLSPNRLHKRNLSHQPTKSLRPYRLSSSRSVLNIQILKRLLSLTMINSCECL